MSQQQPEILIISDRLRDMDPIHQFLEQKQYSVELLYDVKELKKLKDLKSPSLCLVDLSMNDLANSPVHRWIHTHSQVEIVGLCERLLADYAKKEVKYGYLADYLIINPQYDIGRLEFIIQRLLENRMMRQSVANIHAQLDNLESRFLKKSTDFENIGKEITALREQLHTIEHYSRPIQPRNPKVLIASSNKEIVSYLSDILTSVGYQSDFVTTGDMVVSTIQDQPPHLVLMDVNLKSLNGLEVLSRLKKDPRTANIPVLIVTDNATEDLVLEAKQFSIEGFLTPPFHASALSQRIQEVFFRQVTKVGLS